ncbi:SoxR reducing system RseC family protein [Shewanella putrefaciens]|uniref:SoxR reducing system RseC family protein n=1 Tax=Shewanella putrefaciens TaxID=24 RepID=A0ABX8XFC1_SHEPU|nr:SoxR reducing system RseC family protein [Shewanella putrefaciens]CAD6366922.1 Protein RseC [Shewanella hafniensis]AVV83270.1 positive regulator of sigma(E), RseC/MucC [Shewanella putrefaciens]MCT8942527.1 SoxR reducing system RseC family protein [Shewanella putrefaciens]MDR6963223.1 sigma-E factor negative regulatory protein RseC [Shewanella putrefaciens]QSE50442.1 SoxR reducing system RseC family protein [Shewanella putrefaciens]
MMEEVARVVSADKHGWLTVEVELKSTCKSCSGSESCGTSAIAQAFSSKTQQFSIQSERVCEPGELLKLGLPESVILKAAALIYLIPLFGLFIGAALGQFLGHLFDVDSNLFAIALATLGALLAWSFGRDKAKQLEVDAHPVILAYLGVGVSLDKLSD